MITSSSLASRSGCYACLPEHTLRVLVVRLLADQLLTTYPMADVTPNGLMARSGCYACLPDHTLAALSVRLLADLVESGYSALAIIGIDGYVALRARVQHLDSEVVYLKYLATDGDGMGGLFEFDPAETHIDDAIDFIRPNDIDASDPGRWVRSTNP